MNAQQVAVVIADREYKIQCAPGEHALVLRAAALVDTRMREVRQAQKTLTSDRVAVLVALTLASEILKSREDSEGQGEDLARRLQALSSRLDQALNSAA